MNTRRFVATLAVLTTLAAGAPLAAAQGPIKLPRRPSERTLPIPPSGRRC